MTRLMRRTFLLAVFLLACGDDEGGMPPFEEWSAARPVPDGFVVLAEGTQELTEAGSITLTFDLPAEASSIEIAALTLPEHAVQITSILSPSGERHVALPDGMHNTPEAVLTRGFPEAATSDNVTFARFGDASFRYPNDAVTQLEAGRWEITITTFDVDIVVGPGADYRTTRARTPAPIHAKIFGRLEPVTEGAIDLHVLLGPSSGFEADTALDNSALMGALGVIDQIFAQQSVRIREVIFEDVPDLPVSAALERDTCDPSEALRDLGRHVEVTPGYVPIVMIRGFSCLVPAGGGRRQNIGDAIGGFSPGIPGVYASRGEAVLVGTSLLEDFPREWTLIMAHEVAHFLGLMHVTQPNFDLDDNLVDTDVSGNNLMFPLVDQITSEVLSEQQGVVLRQSPYVHRIR